MVQLHLAFTFQFLTVAKKKKKKSHWYIQPVASSEKRVLFLLWLHPYTDRTAISKTWLSSLRGTVPGVSWVSPQSSLVLLQPPGRRAAWSQITQRVGRWHSDTASDSTVTAQWRIDHFFFFIELSQNKYPLEDGRKSSTVNYWLETLGSFKAAVLSLNLTAGSCPPLKTTVRGNISYNLALTRSTSDQQRQRQRLGSFHPERQEKCFTRSRERAYWFSPSGRIRGRVHVGPVKTGVALCWKKIQ